MTIDQSEWTMILTRQNGFVTMEQIGKKWNKSTKTVERFIRDNSKLKQFKKKIGRKDAYLWSEVAKCFVPKEQPGIEAKKKQKEESMKRRILELEIEVNNFKAASKLFADENVVVSSNLKIAQKTIALLKWILSDVFTASKDVLYSYENMMTTENGLDKLKEAKQLLLPLGLKIEELLRRQKAIPPATTFPLPNDEQQSGPHTPTVINADSTYDSKSSVPQQPTDTQNFF